MALSQEVIWALQIGSAAGIAYGVVKATIRALEKNMEKTENNTNDRVGRLSDRIVDMEKVREKIMYREDCAGVRESCRGSFTDVLCELKVELRENRDTHNKHFEEIREFMGYMRRVVEEKNGHGK